MIKSKISTVLKTLRIERNYFDKEYKDINNDKKEKSDDKNMNLDVNVTHAKINEFRKFYDLNEKDYPDELINMSNMFYNCTSLSIVDLSHFIRRLSHA